MTNETGFIKNQVDFNTNLHKDGREFQWPSEILIMIMKGNYIDCLDKNYQGKKVLDIGYGQGNNLYFLATMGMDVYGVEIDDEMSTSMTEKLKIGNFKYSLDVGTNTNLPYEDNYFDYLVSWSVIHYENTVDDLVAAVNEYARVLKPGGRFFLQTAAPNHFIWQNSRKISEHVYEIGKRDDYRKGKILLNFESPEKIRSFFSNKFDNIIVGRTTDNFFDKVTFDLFIASGTKKSL